VVDATGSGSRFLKKKGEKGLEEEATGKMKGERKNGCLENRQGGGQWNGPANYARGVGCEKGRAARRLAGEGRAEMGHFSKNTAGAGQIR